MRRRLALELLSGGMVLGALTCAPGAGTPERERVATTQSAPTPPSLPPPSREPRAEAPSTAPRAAPRGSFTRSELEQLIFARSCGNCRPDRATVARAAPQLLPLMERLATESREEPLVCLVSTMGDLAALRAVDRSPSWLLELANRPGTTQLRLGPLAVAVEIGDPPAIAALVKALEIKVLPGEQALFLGQAIKLAARARSPKVARALERLVDRLAEWPYGRGLAIESIGTIADRESLPFIRGRMIAAPSPELRFALSKLELLHGPNRDPQLLDAVRGSWMSGEFSWYWWALDHILRLNLRHLAGPLRAIYAEKSRLWIEPSQARLLDGIRRLGGAITAEETLLLEKYGFVR